MWPLNDILNALFKSMEVELGGVLITVPNTKYAYRAVFENLINYNNIIAETRLLAEGWKKETATHCEVTNPSRENKALTARTAGTARSSVVPIRGRRNVDVFQQEKLSPASIQSNPKQLPNSSAYLLNTDALDHPYPRVNMGKIMDAHLFIRTIQISPALILGSERVLLLKNYSVSFQKLMRKSIRIPRGT